jgi:hypothetical protein
VDAQRLADDVHDCHPRVEGREGILENDLHLAPESLHFIFGDFKDVHHLPVLAEPDLTCRWLVGTQDAATGGRFAAARLPYQAQGLPLADEKGDPIHGSDVTDHLAEEALLDREVFFQALDI